MLMLAQFAREIELHRLHEKIAKLEGGPDVDHSEFIEDSVRIHDEISKQVRLRFAVFRWSSICSGSCRSDRMFIVSLFSPRTGERPPQASRQGHGRRRDRERVAALSKSPAHCLDDPNAHVVVNDEHCSARA